MIDKQKIILPVRAEFERFVEELDKSLHSEVPLLQKTILQVLRSKGKHIRPLILLLTAKACGKPNEITQSAALIVELMHTTTLIHDDVVDETKLRRGKPSLNAIFDNRIAILTGDFMLSKVLLRAAKTDSLAIVNIIAQICSELSEGELLQLDNAENHSLSEEKYFQMIYKKTAALLSACSKIGALSVGASAETIEKCSKFGEYLGYCFQIKDDIFDYFDDINIGKPTGNDIREAKITLPLLYALNNTEKDKREQLLKIIEKDDYTKEDIAVLINFAKQNGGIEYAQQCIEKYYREAIKIINSLPDSEARESLLMLAKFLTERTC